MITFATAVFFLLITPGPGVMSAAGVGSAFGFQPGIRYLVGLFVGTNLVALAVVSGLAALLLVHPGLQFALFVASAAYLMYLAARIALSGTRIAFIEAKRPPGFMGGIALQAINPKAYVVNTTLFSGFAFWPQSLTLEIVIKFAIINAIWIPIHVLWLSAGVFLHRLDLPKHIQFRINVLMALSMLAVVGLAALAPK
ncbi:MAG: LysE family transporter [Pseudomonadota bacterium]